MSDALFGFCWPRLKMNLMITDPNRYWIRKVEIVELFLKVGQIHPRVVDLSDTINIIVCNVLI